MPRTRFQLIHSEDPAPGFEVERGPRGQGVGRWVPEKKHTWLAKYIEATRAMRKPWPSRVYVDLFCATGRVEVEGEGFTRHGSAPVAWLHSRKGEAAFTRCIVGDLLPERVAACGERLRRLGAPVVGLVGPAEETAAQAVTAVPKGSLALVFLDPYNLAYLSFSVIEQLARLPKVDFAIHFSTMDLRRNVRAEYDPDRARFDAAAPGWRDHIDPAAFHRGDADDAFFAYWCSLIEGLGLKISQRIALVHDDANRQLYHLVFAGRNARTLSIWGEVAQGETREMF